MRTDNALNDYLSALYSKRNAAKVEAAEAENVLVTDSLRDLDTSKLKVGTLIRVRVRLPDFKFRDIFKPT